MRKLLVCLLALGLLAGCSKYENGKPVNAPKQETHVKAEEIGTLKTALKELKQGNGKDVTDARKTTGVITVIMELDSSQGARSQAGGLISNTKKFIDVLDQQPEKVIVNTFYENQKVLQYEMTKDKKLTVVFAHPALKTS